MSFFYIFCCLSLFTTRIIYVDAQLELRAKIRRLQMENQQMQQRMAVLRDETATSAAVTRFLDAIDTMRPPVVEHNT